MFKSSISLLDVQGASAYLHVARGSFFKRVLDRITFNCSHGIYLNFSVGIAVKGSF